MRLLFFAALALLSARALSAADSCVATLQLADSASLTRHLWKLSGLIGSRELSTAAADIVKMLPTERYFGRGRVGASTVFVLLKDSGDDIRTAVLYPVAVTPEAFAKSHQTNIWPCVVFSDDRRWAGAGNSVADARLALEKVSLAERPLSNVVARADVSWKALTGLFNDKVMAEVARMRIQKEFAGVEASSLAELSAELRMGDRSVDLAYQTRLPDSSGIAKWGRSSLPADALAPAETNAVMAFAAVGKLPQIDQNVKLMLEMMTSLGGKKLGCSGRHIAEGFTAFSLSSVRDSTPMQWELPTNAHFGVSLAYEGLPLRNTKLSERLDRILPEFKSRPLVYKLVAVPHLMSQGADVVGHRRVVDRIGEGVAWVWWCEGDCLNGFLRVTADVLQFVSSAALPGIMP